jgi:hypothetical protein
MERTVPIKISGTLLMFCCLVMRLPQTTKMAAKKIYINKFLSTTTAIFK